MRNRDFLAQDASGSAIGRPDVSKHPCRFLNCSGEMQLWDHGSEVVCRCSACGYTERYTALSFDERKAAHAKGKCTLPCPICNTVQI